MIFLKKKHLEFYWKNIISSQKGTFYKFLRLFSVAYRFIIDIRNWMFDNRLLRIHKVKAKVISIGNITVGGTGKTPAVEYLCSLFKSFNKKVSIISRGYGKKITKKNNFILTDGNKIFMKEIECGDEPYMLAKELKDVPILINSSRYKAAALAVNNFKSEIILLDDAFQHRQMFRDINIVVIDASNPFGNSELLPAGILREPLISLKRADLIILTKIEFADNIDDTIKKIKENNSDAPVFKSNYRFRRIKCMLTNTTEKPDFLKGKTLTAVCGIGNPEIFIKMLDKTGCKGINMLYFSDHHYYTYRDINRILTAAKLGDVIVTTHKDAVKLKNFSEYFTDLKNVYYLTLELIIDDKDKFAEFIKTKLNLD